MQGAPRQKNSDEPFRLGRHRTTRRQLGDRAAALAAAAALLGGCGPRRAPAGQEAAAGDTGLRKDVTLQVLSAINAEEQSFFDEVIRRWQATHSTGPKAEHLLPGGNIVEKLLAMLAADTPPDTVAMNPSQAVEFSDRGQLLPLDPFVARDRYDLSDFFPLAITQYEWKGKKYGLPRGMSNQSLYINQDLFDKSGVTYPPTKLNAPGWDFDEFLKAADRLTKRSGDTALQYGFIVGRGLRGGWAQWVRTNGAEIFDKDFTKCTLDDPRAVEGLQFVQDLMYKFRVAPTPQDESEQGGALALFVGAGRAAMRIAPVAEVTRHRQATFRWDYAVNPKGKGSRLTTGGGVAWSIPAATRHKEEAWAVFRHLVSSETTKHMATVWYPGRKSAVQYLQTVDPDLPPKSRWVGANGQTVIHPDPIFPLWTQIERDLVTPEFQPLWRGEKTAKQVADVLVPKVNAFLKEQRRG